MVEHIVNRSCLPDGQQKVDAASHAQNTAKQSRRPNAGQTNDRTNKPHHRSDRRQSSQPQNPGVSLKPRRALSPVNKATGPRLAIGQLFAFETKLQPPVELRLKLSHRAWRCSISSGKAPSMIQFLSVSVPNGVRVTPSSLKTELSPNKSKSLDVAKNQSGISIAGALISFHCRFCLLYTSPSPRD